MAIMCSQHLWHSAICLSPIFMWPMWPMLPLCSICWCCGWEGAVAEGAVAEGAGAGCAAARAAAIKIIIVVLLSSSVLLRFSGQLWRRSRRIRVQSEKLVHDLG